MKCPRCDTDITTQRKCGKCGINVDDDLKELEVEYKDFKTSELLEIRQKRHPGLSAAKTTTVKKQSFEIASESKDPEKSTSDNEKKFPLVSIFVLVLMLIAGAFFLYRYIID